jgi:hypothetical protein
MARMGGLSESDSNTRTAFTATTRPACVYLTAADEDRHAALRRADIFEICAAGARQKCLARAWGYAAVRVASLLHGRAGSNFIQLRAPRRR